MNYTKWTITLPLCFVIMHDQHINGHDSLNSLPFSKHIDQNNLKNLTTTTTHLLPWKCSNGHIKKISYLHLEIEDLKTFLLLIDQAKKMRHKIYIFLKKTIFLFANSLNIQQIQVDHLNLRK